MKITPEKLRRLAKMAPMFAAEFNAAADELARLLKGERELYYLIKNSDGVDGLSNGGNVVFWDQLTTDFGFLSSFPSQEK